MSAEAAVGKLSRVLKIYTDKNSTLELDNELLKDDLNNLYRELEEARTEVKDLKNQLGQETTDDAGPVDDTE